MTESDAEKRRIERIFAPQTLTQVGHPAVLKVLEESDRIKDFDSTMSHVMHVQQWYKASRWGPISWLVSTVAS